MEYGIYEKIINQKDSRFLSEIPDSQKLLKELHGSEANSLLTAYIGSQLMQALEQISNTDAAGETDSQKVQLVNSILQLLNESREKNAEGNDLLLPEGKKPSALLSLADEKDLRFAAGQKIQEFTRPETSMARSSLFTASHGEPKLHSELCREIETSDEIYVLVSFLKVSGLRVLMPEFEKFTSRGGKLHVLTTTYMGATDPKAVADLAKLPNCEVRISYDSKSTRLHAKSWIFERKTGFSTAYVGSSNLSWFAMDSGKEWNAKMTEQDMPEILGKMKQTFKVYWNSDEFEPFSLDDLPKLERIIKEEKGLPKSLPSRYSTDMQVHAFPFQQRILDALEAERTLRDRHRNLVVAATGTGKTVMSALDYARYASEYKKKTGKGNPRLLFLAHRDEILTQAQATFAKVMQDGDFGSKYTGTTRPEQMDQLFMTIQSLNSKNIMDRLDPSYYDFVICDEIHHAYAPSWRKFLEWVNPDVLLGLTATPERMDGKDITDFFDNRIAASIRLPEAIEEQLLVPFQYFGVTDNIDLKDLRWSRGGYDIEQLTEKYTNSGQKSRDRAQLVLETLLKYVPSLEETCAIGFCVSIEHAKFMTEYFQDKGVACAYLTGESSKEEREQIPEKLKKGELQIVFTVDLYNEGVDIPEINTVLFLRPTQSQTIFLQQLGRGLRKFKNKDSLLVLDFVGQANRKFDFSKLIQGMLSKPVSDLGAEVREGFPHTPNGCTIMLEEKPKEIILENLRQSWRHARSLLSWMDEWFEQYQVQPNLRQILEAGQYSPRQFYAKWTWEDLVSKTKAGLQSAGSVLALDDKTKQMLLAASNDNDAEDMEKEKKAWISAKKNGLFRMACTNDVRWLSFLLGFLPELQKENPWDMLSKEEELMIKMMYVSFFDKLPKSFDDPEFVLNMRRFAKDTLFLKELEMLLTYLLDIEDLVHEPSNLPYDNALSLHSTYTKNQLLTALGYDKPQIIREGVKWLPQIQTDVLLITLHKKEKQFSPTTMYEDYPISNTLFHWQSQSGTTPESNTGQRYIHHEENGSKVLLFVREIKDEYAKAVPYTYLGEADFVSYEGSAPMSIVWKLHNKIPAKYLSQIQSVAV